MMEWENSLIAYRPGERTVNAAHLIKLGDESRRKQTGFFERNPTTPRHVYNGDDPRTQGTYILYEDAAVLCAYFSLSPGPVERLIELASAPHFAPGDAPGAGMSDPDVPKPTATTTTSPFNSQPSGSDDQAGGGGAANEDSGDSLAFVDHGVHVASVGAHAGSSAYYTEPDYTHGSYLAPPDRSYEQLRDGLVGGGKTAQDAAPYGPGSPQSHRSWQLGVDASW